MTGVATRSQRLKRALRDGGLGLAVAALGALLIIGGGPLGIFIGIPLAAGGAVALGFGLTGLVRYGLIPGRRVYCPRCRTEQTHLRELPYAPCGECGLPHLLTPGDKLVLGVCERCGAEFACGDADGDGLACPDCGRLHRVVGGEVFPMEEATRLPELGDFTPRGEFYGERSALRRAVRRPAGELWLARQLTQMLQERKLVVVHGELVARTRALGESLRSLVRALEEGAITAAPDCWPELKNQAARLFHGWGRYLDIIGSLVMRGGEVEADFPVAEALRLQHKLAEYPGFGERWSVDAAAMRAQDRWLAPSLYSVEEPEPLYRLAAELAPGVVSAHLDEETRGELLKRFAPSRLKGARRNRVARRLELDPDELTAFADLSFKQDAAAGLALRGDEVLAYDKRRLQRCRLDQLHRVRFSADHLNVELTDGTRWKLSARAPRNERSIVFLLDEAPPADRETVDDD